MLIAALLAWHVQMLTHAPYVEKMRLWDRIMPVLATIAFTWTLYLALVKHVEPIVNNVTRVPLNAKYAAKIQS